MKDKHDITTTGLFVATAAAAAAGAALKTAVDQYQGASDGPALERAFDALVHEFFTGGGNRDQDAARELCLKKLRSFTTFAGNKYRTSNMFTHDGNYAFKDWKGYYEDEKIGTLRRQPLNWGEAIDAQGMADIERIRKTAEEDRTNRDATGDGADAGGGGESDDNADDELTGAAGGDE
jgi:hypothetical protein